MVIGSEIRLWTEHELKLTNDVIGELRHRLRRMEASRMAWARAAVDRGESVECPLCEGSGEAEDQYCGFCNGTAESRSGPPDVGSCGECGGSGQAQAPCSWCKGECFITAERLYQVFDFAERRGGLI